ncbi:hypothetical protein NDU88_005191 [Pleurodeles waltl]|uniref:Uncharacterized protein n=1 Tax=Pleurodeles waltl TaxID=8319 RepID=A0AAV7NVX1_PLEWA|nr:hypothetical protein NDU88_005191 [Pleurodeles waltl]
MHGVRFPRLARRRDAHAPAGRATGSSSRPRLSRGAHWNILLRRVALRRIPVKPRGKPRSGSRVAVPAAALFSGHALFSEHGGAGHPEFSRGSRYARRE